MWRQKERDELLRLLQVDPLSGYAHVIVPSARQNASMLSVSTRLHLGQRFIFCSGSPLGNPTYALDVPIGKFELTDNFQKSRISPQWVITRP